jgi:hypothetical protein
MTIGDIGSNGSLECVTGSTAVVWIAVPSILFYRVATAICITYLLARVEGHVTLINPSTSCTAAASVEQKSVSVASPIQIIRSMCGASIASPKDCIGTYREARCVGTIPDI